MQAVDSKEKYYMREIATLLSGKTSEVLGAPEGTGAKTIDLVEIKKRVEGAAYDEPRVVRALDRMVHSGALNKAGYRWTTTPRFSKWTREIRD